MYFVFYSGIDHTLRSHILRRVHADHRAAILHVARQQLHVDLHHFHLRQHNRMVALVQHGARQLHLAVQQQRHGQIVLEYRLGGVQRRDVPVCKREL